MVYISALSYSTTQKVHMDTPSIKHHLGISYSYVPFIWHYNEFAQPFPSHLTKSVTSEQFLDRLAKFDYKKNYALTQVLNGFTNENSEFFVNCQFKLDRVFYNEDTPNSELYVSFHPWLYRNHTGKDTIEYVKRYCDIYRYNTGLYSVSGLLKPSNTYPNIIKKNRHGKITEIPGGIPIDSQNLPIRQSTIHDYGGILRFSSVGVCNFDALSDNVVFVSVVSKPYHIEPKQKQKELATDITTDDGKVNCVTLHVFRNVFDNGSNNEDYQQIIRNVK